MIACDNRFISLKGNHEDMLIKAARSWFIHERTGSDYRLLCSNGGYETFNDMINDEWNRSWINHIDQYPTHIELTNIRGEQILLSHAGYTPRFDDNNNIYPPEDEDLLWDRTHYIYEACSDCDNVIVIHGHTPIKYILQSLKIKRDDIITPLWYDNNHKVCIDCGSAFTKKCCLLNIDNWEYHIFEDNTNETEE